MNKSRNNGNIYDTIHKRTPGEIVVSRRKDMQWTQEDLAWQSKISVTQIGRIERNQVMPCFDTIEKLENALGIELLDAFLEYRRTKCFLKKERKASEEMDVIRKFEIEARKRNLDEDQISVLLNRVLNEADSKGKEKL